MYWRTALVILTLVMGPAQSDAGWAAELFLERDHDFGSVERGTTLHHAFLVSNTGPRPVRIRNLRVSCGCTKVTPSSYLIGAGSSATIDAVMDTSSFLGDKSVTIYIQFDRPRRSQAALRVHCTSVGNIAHGPNEIDFGIVPVGTEAERRWNVDYAGNSDWKVVGLDYASPFVEAEITEVERKNDKVRYELRVVINDQAPPGLFEDRLRIHTNDPEAAEILVHAKAKIESRFAVSPEILHLGTLVPGQTIQKHVIVKGQRPFVVLRADHTNNLVAVRSATEPKTTQLVMLTFTVPADTSELPDHLELVTDVTDETVSIEIAE